jgi:hypothetical protein
MIDVLISVMALVGVRVALFDDARDRAGLRVHDAPVPRRVLDLGRQDRQRGLGLTVLRQAAARSCSVEAAACRRADQDVAVARPSSSSIVGSATETACPVPSCSLCSTNTRFASARARSVKRLFDPGGPVAHDDDRGAHVVLGGGVEHVEHHRSSTEVVERFGPRVDFIRVPSPAARTTTQVGRLTSLSLSVSFYDSSNE